MGNEERTTVYNNITTKDLLVKVNPDNLELEDDFLDYLVSVDRAETTIKQYKAILHIFWVWNLENNNNKSFVNLHKREIVKFQNHAINNWGWSSNRMKTVRAVMKSLENYIIKILDDEYPNYKPIWDKIEVPTSEAVRPKSVFTDAEIQKLLDTLTERGEYAKACLVSLAANSGRRKAELCRFKVSYFVDDYLICGGALYKSPERIRTKGHGRLGKLLFVYTLAKPFKPYLDLWLAERERLGITSEWLFPMIHNGKAYDCPMLTSQIDSWCKSFSEITGKTWYMHSMRHYFVSKLSRKDIPAKVIKDIIGWDDVSLVSVYDDTEVEENFDKYFGAEGIKEVEKKSLSDLE